MRAQTVAMQVQTRLSSRQAEAFNEVVRLTGCSKSATARQLICLALEEMGGFDEQETD